MATSPIHPPVLAGQKEDENWRFRRFLKERSELDGQELDQLVLETSRRVWAGIDCTRCANCCRTVRPTFSDRDVQRLSSRLGVEPRQLISTSLEPTEAGDDNPWRTRTAPCPFLKDDRCDVYEDRPADCRGYPYLDKPGFVARTTAMIERTFTCPVVYDVMEELKRSVGFRGTKRK